MIEYTVKVFGSGDRWWWYKGELHREDGPAIERANGTKFWIRKDKLHRENGPAIEQANGHKTWYLSGKKCTEKEFNKKMSPTKDMTVAEISKALGYEVRITK